MQLGTFTVDVVVDGEVLEEYNIVIESPTKVTCWIASEEGKLFSIKWTCHEEVRVSGSRLNLSVDGLGCQTKRIPPGKLGVNSTGKLSYFVNRTTHRKLMFSRVQLSNDDSLLDKKITKYSGEIQLTIQRGTVIRKRTSSRRTDKPVPDDNVFHERNKKATVHCLGFGPEIPRRPRSSHSSRLIPSTEPMLTFTFKYRPLDVLQADGVAPRPPPKADREFSLNERDVTSEDAEPAGLDDRIRSLENELKRLRDLQDSVCEERKPKQIKREEQVKRKVAEIIDLT